MTTPVTSQSLNKQTPVWTYWNIFISTAIAGPLAGIYLFSQNDKALGLIKRSKQALIFGALSFFALLVLAWICLPEENFGRGSFPIPAIFAATISSIHKAKQGSAIKEAIENEHPKGSILKLLLIMMISMAITFAFGVGLAIVVECFS